MSFVALLPCPCCGGKSRPATLTGVLSWTAYRDYTHGAAILKAVWQGNGEPVLVERCIQAMWKERPDDRPEDDQAYKAFKVALSRLKRRLKGAGVTIVNCGYGRGYKIITDTPS